MSTSHPHSHSHGHDDHGHPHGVGHHCHTSGQNVRSLSWVLIITTLYMLVELIGGFWTGSLALLADAGHMLTDAGAIALALLAAWFAAHPPSVKNTYGYYRLEILAAFINGVALAVISIIIFYEAWLRLNHPGSVEGSGLIWIATGGLMVNLLSAFILSRAGRDNINIRGALLHVLSDCLGSLGAIIAGCLILFYGFQQADAIISIIIALLVLFNAWKLILEATNVLLEGCPVHLNVDDIRRALTDLPEVSAIHDLHVWSITIGREAMSVHIEVTDIVHFTPELLTKIQMQLKEHFGLDHITIQLEPPGFEESAIQC